MQEDRVYDIPSAPAPESDYSKVIHIITQWRLILNARLLCMLALGGALAVFGFTLYEPEPLRLWGASLYSVGVLWPVIWLYLKKA